MASRRAARLKVQLAQGRDRWRRWVMLAQGAYYVITGLWPLVHFPSFAEVVGQQINPFQAQAFGAVIIVVGAALIEAARREPPGAYPTMLGTAVASAIAIVSLFWLPRSATSSGLWLDFIVEVAIAAALILLYPRPLAERGRPTTRRR